MSGTTSGSGNESGGELDVTANGNVSIGGPVDASGASGGDGGTVSILTDLDGDITMTGDITANGGGPNTSGGSIGLEAYGPHSIAVAHTSTLEANGSDGPDSSDGTVTVGPACTISVSGFLHTNGFMPAWGGLLVIGVLDNSGNRIDLCDAATTPTEMAVPLSDASAKYLQAIALSAKLSGRTMSGWGTDQTQGPFCGIGITSLAFGLPRCPAMRASLYQACTA